MSHETNTAKDGTAKKSLQPKLRFSEFKGAWDVPSLGEVSDRIVEKVGTQSLETISISAGVGFVSQAEKFSRDISGEQYKNYIVLNEGDFSYNKGNSKKFPQGCVYKLTNFKRVAAPNAFISFKFKKDYVPDFYQGYFENNFHGEQLKKFITSGARSNGLLNIRADDFFSIKLPTPVDRNEQQKIADCLTSIDDLITAQTQKLDALKNHKNGLMQHLFPAEGETVPKLRFSEFRDAGEWVETLLGKHCEITTGKLDANAMVENGKYRFYTCAKDYYFIDDYAFDTDALLISGNGANVGYIHHYNGKFNAYQRTYVLDQFTQNIFFVKYYLERNLHKRISTEKKDGNTPYIVMSTLTEMVITLPNNNEEQQKIAECLTAIDDLITAQTQKLDSLKHHKKGLMQQLFPAVNETQR